MLKKLLVATIFVIVLIFAVVGRKVWRERILPPPKPTIAAKEALPAPDHFIVNAWVVLDGQPPQPLHEYMAYTVSDTQWVFTVSTNLPCAIIVGVAACNEYGECVGCSTVIRQTDTRREGTPPRRKLALPQYYVTDTIAVVFQKQLTNSNDPAEVKGMGFNPPAPMTHQFVVRWLAYDPNSLCPGPYIERVVLRGDF